MHPMYSLEAGEISLINVHGHLFREHVRKNAPVAKNDQQQSEEQSIDVSKYAIEEKDGRFTLQVLFPNELFGRLIGAKGKTLKSIERKSQANVVIPRGEGAVSVTVNGRSKTSVAIAAKEIEAILSGLRDSAPFTHFISLPLTTDAQVMAKLKEFLGLVDGLPGSEKAGYDASISLNPGHFHITLIMLKLLTSEEVSKATKLMESLSSTIYDALGTRTLLLTLRGVDIMSDEGPDQARSVFAKIVVDDDRLERVISELFRRFKDAGLVPSDQDEHVKLHATILNTRFRKTDNPYAKKVLLDARTILAKFGDFEFGKMRIEAIHLSQRFKYDSNGYFHCTKHVQLP